MVFRMKMRKWETRLESSKVAKKKEEKKEEKMIESDQKLKGKEPELRKQKKDEDEEKRNKTGLLGASFCPEIGCE